MESRFILVVKCNPDSNEFDKTWQVVNPALEYGIKPEVLKVGHSDVILAATTTRDKLLKWLGSDVGITKFPGALLFYNEVRELNY